MAPHLLFEVGSALAWTAIWSYFASYTYFHWARRERRGLWHAWTFAGFLLAAGLVGLGKIASVWSGMHGAAKLLLVLVTVFPQLLLGGALLWLATRPAAKSAFAPAPPAEPVPRPQLGRFRASPMRLRRLVREALALPCVIMEEEADLPGEAIDLGAKFKRLLDAHDYRPLSWVWPRGAKMAAVQDELLLLVEEQRRVPFSESLQFQ